MKIYLRPYIIILAIICVISCLGTEADLLNNHFPPKVSTDEAEISEKMIQVILNGSYEQSETSSYIDECGFYYGPDAKLTSSEKIVATDRAGDFSTNVTPEDYGIRYYYKAYISNDRSELTSSTKSFQMPDFDHFVRFVSPTVISSEDGDVTVSSSVEVATGITITEAGILYSKDPEVTCDDERITSPNYQDVCVEITNLTIGERYYMCSYVKSGKYVAYSGIVEFTPYSVPTLTTTDITEIGYNSAVAGAKDISGNGLEVMDKGVVWSTEPKPIYYLPSKTKEGKGTDSFLSTINRLSPGTKYYLRAYAVNFAGVGYGNEITFETLSLSGADVLTTSPSDITSSSAMSGGNVTSDGGAEVTSRGVAWGKEHNPTISLDTKTSDGSGVGKFTSAITGLEPGTTYYVRAFATNALGTSYGEEVPFTTQAVKPTVSTTEADEVTLTSAKVGGNVTATGGAEVTERGIVWSTSKNPTTSGNKKQVGNGVGSFTTELADLKIATTYYVRAYAINSVGTSYGEEISFTTGSAKPAVTTVSPSEVTSSSAVSGGNVTSDGGSAVTARGVVWSKDHNPNISLSTKTTNGTGTGSYVSSISGLEPGVTYYVRAYATNANGTSYGEELSFTTDIELPTVQTEAISSISSKTACSGGKVISNGGASISAYGIVWNTSPNPTIDLSSKTKETASYTNFSSTMSNLKPNTKYYVRAYATNSKGTAYGNELSFTTKAEGSNEGVGNEDFEWEEIRL